MFKRLISDSLFYTFANALSRVLGLLLLPLYTRYFSPDDYGVLSLFTIFGVLVTQIISMQMDQALGRYYSEYKSPKLKNAVAVSAFVYYLASFGLGMLVLLAFSKPISYLLIGTFNYSAVFMLMVVSIGFRALLNYNICLWRYQLQVKLSTVFLIGDVIGSIFSICLFVVVFNFNLEGIYLGQISSSLIIVAMMMLINKKSYHFGLLSKSIIMKMLRYSAPLVPAALIYLSMQYIDQIMIKWLLTLDSVGIYSISLRLASGINLLLVGFQAAWAPLVFRNYHLPEAKTSIAAVFLIVGIGGACLIMMTTVFIPEILRVLVSSSYYESYICVPYLMFSSLFICLGRYFAVGINIANKTNWFVLSTVISAFINIVLNIVFIPSFGLLGAAVATMISALFLMVIEITISQHYFKINYNFYKLSFFLLFSLVFIIIMQYTFKNNVSVNAVLIKLIVLMFLAGFILPFVRRLTIFKLYPKKEIVL